MRMFYSVIYRKWGADAPSEKWFDDKEKAYDFAKRDYTDNPVAHRVSKKETIDEYERLVAECEWEDTV